ncbi:hypothetical protein jhhlp_006939 [Lomentospora prolificans]|uniref:CHL4 family chromosome segregation protein n=1 Tax=Lomentospora prolificans TaxID=41688 RepID=A0A2N3N367_9PEZI|nr:hypothetical protein jhhlp_006939 [Lomentospora prolificans]
MPSISLPTKAGLPSSLRMPADNPVIRKALHRLSRASLLGLVLDWLDDRNVAISPPYLSLTNRLDDLDEASSSLDFYPPATSVQQLRDIYAAFQERKGSKREILDRVLKGDWRHGLTLYQLSMADLQYLYDHPTSQKWAAYHIRHTRPRVSGNSEKAPGVNNISTSIPRIHPSSFLEHMQSQVLPDTKVHFQFDRPHNMRLVILRIFILDSPYNTSLALSHSNAGILTANADSTRTIYAAFPDGAPFIYLSSLGTTSSSSPAGTKGLRHALFDAIQASISKPGNRYSLAATSMVARSLHSLLHYRGAGRSNVAGGGWSAYTDATSLDTPLDTIGPKRALSGLTHDSLDTTSPYLGKRQRSIPTSTIQVPKRARSLAQARFGDSARISHREGLEQTEIIIRDPYPAMKGRRQGSRNPPNLSNIEDTSYLVQPQRRRIDAPPTEHPRRGIAAASGRVGRTARTRSELWSPHIKLLFRGPHVFSGVRQLVEAGVIDGSRMPSWLTGEDNVSIGFVRNGRVDKKSIHLRLD